MQHLNTDIPPDYEEMSCDSCMGSLDFLHIYKLRTVPVKLQREPESEETPSLEVVKEEDGKKPETTNGGCSHVSDSAVGITAESLDQVPKAESSGGSGATETVSCKFQERKRALATAGSAALGGHQGGGGAGFFSNKLRQQLCKCSGCVVSRSE